MKLHLNSNSKVAAGAALFALSLSSLRTKHPLVAGQDFPPEGNEWIPPGDGDVRSPCPFINTLANHGYIDRSGKNVDLYGMVTQLSVNFDVTEDLFLILAAGAEGLNWTTTDDDGTVRIDIDELFNPGQEHDASFVRADKYFGFEESMMVDVDLVEALLSSGDDPDVLTMEDLMAYQYSRILDSRTNNPEHFFAEGQATSFSAQATLILAFGQDPMLENVSKDRLREFFTFERFPEGYEPLAMNSTDAVNVIGDGTLANDVRLEYAASFLEAISVDLESDATMNETMMDGTMAPTPAGTVAVMTTDSPTGAPSGSNTISIIVAAGIAVVMASILLI